MHYALDGLLKICGKPNADLVFGEDNYYTEWSK